MLIYSPWAGATGHPMLANGLPGADDVRDGADDVGRDGMEPPWAPSHGR